MRNGLFLMLTTAFFGMIVFSGCSDRQEEKTVPANAGTEKTAKSEKKIKKIKEAKGHLGAKRRSVLPERSEEKRSFDAVNPKLVSRLAQNAIERKDLATLSSFAARARNSKSPEVRGIVVEALGWFEDKAIPDLLLFVNDEDPDVSAAALRLLDLHFDGVGKDRDKAALIEAAMPYLPDEMVDVFVSKFDNIDTRRSFVKIMSMMDDYADDPVVLDALIRQYEFISGENFTDKATAFKWFFATEKQRLKSQK